MEMNRRRFVAGATAAAGLSLAGVGSAMAAAADFDPSVTASVEDNAWLGEAPQINDDQCVETVDCDVLVIGSGGSGTTAAVSAALEGAQVLVVEKHVCSRYGGNAHSYINSKKLAECGLPCEYDPQEIVWEHFKETQHSCDMALVSLWANRGHEVIDSLIELTEGDEGGAIYVNALEGYDPRSQLCGIHPFFNPGTPEDNNGVWLGALNRAAVRQGAEFRYSTPAVSLIQDEDGRVVGAYCTNPSGDYIRVNAAKGVIVCAGDYASNDEMIATFQPVKQQMIQKAHNLGGMAYVAYMDMDQWPEGPLNTGDGIKMACWAGASVEPAPHGFNTWTVGGDNCKAHLHVNSGGRRFMNEATSMMVSALVTLAQPGDETFYWQIVDQDLVDTPMEGYLPMKAPVEVSIDVNSGEWVSGNTIEELAESMGVLPEVLAETVERYNELCDKGIDEDYYKESRFMRPLKTPPFYAAKQQHAWCVTFGGIYVTPKLEVVGPDGAPIKGLYAAGNTVGRRFGYHYEGAFMGCSNAFAETHGWFAAKNCVADN